MDRATSEAHFVPFPRARSDGDLNRRSTEPTLSGGSNDLSPQPSDSANPLSNQSPTSHTTSSSKQTSSDKLSALPTSQSTPNTHRLLRSPTSASGTHSRGYRRSLDASVSLPSFAIADFESPRNTVHNMNSHMGASGTYSRATNSGEGSPDKAETPKQRVSFESDRGSLPPKQIIRQAISHMSKGSDLGVASPILRSYGSHRDSQDLNSPSGLGSRSPSRSRSRAASPLRIFQQLSASLHRGANRGSAEERFVPIDPFRLKTHLRLKRRQHTHTHPPDVEMGSLPSSIAPHECPACIPTSSVTLFWRNTRIFMGDILPRQVYLNLLLRLPAMYFTRVSRIFEDAEVSRPDIERMIDARGGGAAYMLPSASETINMNAGMAESNQGREPGVMLSPSTTAAAHAAHVGMAAAAVPFPLPFPDDWSPPIVSPALIRFKHSWEAFIDSLLREWKTLNVVSALLLSAILTMFQIPSAEEDPITRTAALLSLVCALMSLSYGCMYIVRFGTMRSMYRASRWAQEARKTNTAIWWNVWVLLAMPVVWMSWSMLLFIVSILSFVWRTGSAADPAQRTPFSSNGALGARIAVTGVFSLGMLFMLMIVRTLKSYGMHEEQAGLGVGVWSTPGSYRSETRASLRARDPTASVERRGRERKRSALGGRRGAQLHSGVPNNRETERDVVGREKGGLKTMLGLGLGMRDLDTGIEMDLQNENEKMEI